MLVKGFAWYEKTWAKKCMSKKPSVFCLLWGKWRLQSCSAGPVLDDVLIFGWYQSWKNEKGKGIEVLWMQSSCLEAPEVLLYILQKNIHDFLQDVFELVSLQNFEKMGRMCFVKKAQRTVYFCYLWIQIIIGVLYLKRGLGSKFLWEFQMGWNVLQIFVRSFSLKSFTCFVNLCLYRPEILGVVAKRQEDASFSYRQNFCCLKFCGSTRSVKKKPKFQHPYNLLPDSRCVIAVLKCKSGFDSLSFLGERSFVNNGSESSKNALFWAEQKEKKYTTSTKSVFRFLSALR